MIEAIEKYNDTLVDNDKIICDKLLKIILQHFPEAEYKIWHKHPVWFFDKNPVLGYSKLKAGIRLMFWSGASFSEDKLKAGTGKFKDASILYTSPDQISTSDIQRWIEKGRSIQWDYKNIYKTKGKLTRLK